MDQQSRAGFALVSETIPQQRPAKRWRKPAGKHALTYLALGAGSQSSALYVLAAQGDRRVPPLDVAIFADTGDEPAKVYEQLDRLEAYGKRLRGPRIMRVSIPSGRPLSELMLTHYVPIPAFTLAAGKRGMLLRQCTTEMKVKPINAWLREHELGVPAGGRVGPDQRVLCLKGFSIEEIGRVKPSNEAWLDIAFPLIDAGLYRWHCQQVLVDAGLGRFVKSACVYCPYRGDREWRRMRDEEPADFAKACAVDEAIRNTAQKGQRYEFVQADGTMASRRIGTPGRGPEGRNGVRADALYVHPSCRPLREIDFGDQEDAFDNECSGHCGI